MSQQPRRPLIHVRPDAPVQSKDPESRQSMSTLLLPQMEQPAQLGVPGSAAFVRPRPRPMPMSSITPMARPIQPGVPGSVSYAQPHPQPMPMSFPIARPIQSGVPGLATYAHPHPQPMPMSFPITRPIQSGIPGSITYAQPHPHPTSMAPLPSKVQSVQPGLPQAIKPTAIARLQQKLHTRLLLPKPEKQSGRVSLATKARHLQEWFQYTEKYRELVGGEPEMREYEKRNNFPHRYIARLLANKEKLEHMPSQTLAKRFNVGTRPFYPVEIVLVRMIDEIRAGRTTIDQRLIQIMAHEVYTLLLSQVGPLKFNRPSFSSGWVYSFRKYWKIEFHQLKGQAGSVDMEKIAGEVEAIKDVVAGYSLDDVYNADETGLFLQTMSNWTLNREKTSGYKSATPRVSILFCVNATGTDKRKPLILSKCVFLVSTTAPARTSSWLLINGPFGAIHNGCSRYFPPRWFSQGL